MKFFDEQDGRTEEAGAGVTEVAAGPVPLSTVRPGRTVRIECLPVCGQAASRLCALGLTPGTEFKVVHNMFGPIVLEVRGSRLSLGHGLASRVLVSPARNGAGRPRGGRG